ncbi:hypothetical protein T4D_6927 [Trichinella pseudospiralis]|uniref:Uncharacterized protein n=1 Tax=Trichinella pseudospiralis TaxID=6337 RepID=A0A0V1FTU5_TRIPS|nr:hypothetical protein T4D_6927 [Trichinella pseudospiralis]
MQITLPVMRKGKFDCLTYSSAVLWLLSQSSEEMLCWMSSNLLLLLNYGIELNNTRFTASKQLQLDYTTSFNFCSRTLIYTYFMQVGDQQLPSLYQRLVVVHWIL